MGLVARDAELAVIAGVLDQEPAPVQALVLEGEPGVGKTSLWEQALVGAQDRGLRVLSARASASETELPFAGMIDLLDGVRIEELGMPAPQLHALEVALYRADPGEQPPTEQVVSLALLSALRALARHQRLLVAVDDLQWLDASSLTALAYVARRLPDDVTVVVARRPGAPTAVEQAFRDGLVEHLAVRATTLGGTRQILASRLGLRLPHHLLRRVYDTTLGNPLFALEVGRLLARLDPATLGDELPVPDAVEDLLGLRVADLDPTTRRLLLALALDADLRVPRLEALFGPDALQRASAAGVVDLDGERVRSAHPLLAQAARRAASEAEVRGLHADLAAVVSDDPCRMLQHLALATTEPDALLAERLDGAATRAVARGSIRLAADLAVHALRLTPTGDPEAARVMVLAKVLHMAGEKQRLTELLGPRAATLPDRADRVRAYVLLTGGVVQGNADIRALLQQALDEAGDDHDLRLRVLCHLAENEAVIAVRHVALADARAAQAVEASATGTGGDQRLALFTRVWTSALRGRPLDDLLERYEALASRSTYLARTPGRVAGQQHVWRGEPGPARERFEAFRVLAAERGEPNAYALARLHLCELELRVGGWDAAEELLDEWAASTDSSLLHWPMYERCRSLLAAGRGDAAAARDWAQRAVAQADETGVRWDWLEATRATGVADLLDHRPDEAAGRLRAVWSHTREEGVLDPGAFPAAPDLVEALADVGDPDALAEAREVVDALADAADLQDHGWARLAAARGSATLALAGGWSDADAAALAGVASGYQDRGLVAEAARTWLALGRAQRRSRKWGAARQSLECAVGLFEAQGAPGWADAARGELERVGARRPGAPGRLTTTERRVADLATQGLANKEIARALVVTVSTVEFHLRNAYTKLGIRSRMELAPRLADLDADVT